jgi:hypothetical protein
LISSGAVCRRRRSVLAFYDFPAEHWKHLRSTNPIKTPDIEKVLEGLNRKAPEGVSLRRKKRRQDGMADAREEAWREMVDELTSAWRGPR